MDQPGTLPTLAQLESDLRRTLGPVAAEMFRERIQRRMAERAEREREAAEEACFHYLNGTDLIEKFIEEERAASTTSTGEGR